MTSSIMPPTAAPTSDGTAEVLHTLINEFRDLVLQDNVEDMSKKQAQRYALSLQRILIECAENPVERTNELSPEEQRYCAKFADIRHSKFLLLCLVNEDKERE